jgi:hypothetical protein
MDRHYFVNGKRVGGGGALSEVRNRMAFVIGGPRSRGPKCARRSQIRLIYENVTILLSNDYEQRRRVMSTHQPGQYQPSDLIKVKY